MLKGARRILSFRTWCLAFGLCAVLAAGAAAEARAQKVTAFTFEGRLSEAGSPAEGVYDLQFDLCDAATDGDILGTVFKEDVAVTAGAFAVTLDYGVDPFADDSGRYLQIGVRPGASEDKYSIVAPREALTASPYAVKAVRAQRAANAEKLGGQPPASYLRSDESQSFTGGRLTIGASSVLDVTAGALVGDGANLTGLNASYVTAGVLDDARLSTNVVRRNAAVRFTSLVDFELPPFARGTNITDLRANHVTTGVLDDARLSANVPRLNAGNTFTAANNNFTGTISANGLNVGGGLPVRRILAGAATLDFGSGRVFQQTLDISVPGASVGDAVFLGIPANVLPQQVKPAAPAFGTSPAVPASTATEPYIFQAYVSAPDVVSVTWMPNPYPHGFISMRLGPTPSACLSGDTSCHPPPGLFRVVVFSFAP